MKLKLDDDGHVVLSDGKPVYVGDDGKEFPYDLPSMHQMILRQNKENLGFREAKEELEAKVKLFEGLDPKAARKALELTKNLDDSKLADAGKIEEIKLAAIKSVEDRYKPVAEEAEQLRRELYSERVGGQFARSKFIAEKTILPPDIAQATFGKHFELKDGKTLAKDANGNLIYSDANPGSPADFEEAMEKLVAGYSHRDRILKGSGHNGSGSGPVEGGGGRTVTRKQFGTMSPVEQQKVATSVREGSVKIID